MILLNPRKSRILLNGHPMEFQLQFSMDSEMLASIQEILTLNKFFKKEQELKSNVLKSVSHLWEKSLTTLNMLLRFHARKSLRKRFSKVSLML